VASSIRKKLAITSPKSGGRSVGIVRSPTQTMEFSFSLVFFTAIELSNASLVGILNIFTNYYYSQKYLNK
jgi:hypothetical protein